MDSLCKICENTGFHWPVFSRILASFEQWLFILFRIFSTIYGCISLHEKCPNREFFLFCIFPYLDWMRENTEHKKISIWTLFTQCKSFSYTCCMNFSVAFKNSLLLVAKCFPISEKCFIKFASLLFFFYSNHSGAAPIRTEVGLASQLSEKVSKLYQKWRFLM